MTNLTSEAIDARCGDCVRVTVGFRGVRLDRAETPDDRKVTGLDDFGSSDSVSDWMG
jgi:hypothetical protein